jgi:hypothetical protein
MVVHLAGQFAPDLDRADPVLEHPRENAFDGVLETAFKPFETHEKEIRAGSSRSDAGRFDLGFEVSIPSFSDS